VSNFQTNLTTAKAAMTTKKLLQLCVPYPIAAAIKIKITNDLAKPNIFTVDI